MTDAKPDTWMPLVIGDYLKDTSRLTTEQHGAYLLLIMSYWVDGPPPDDDEELAAITRLDRRTWRRQRLKLEKFFRVEDGVWRHKRIDEELERWSAKKARYAERAAAGGRAKAAKSSASSKLQAGDKQPVSSQKGCLEAAPQPASRRVEGPKKPSTPSGRATPAALADGARPPPAWPGPATVREAFVRAMGEPWVVSYLDPSAWQDVPDRAIVPATRHAGSELVRGAARKVLAAEGLTVLERAA